MTVTSLRAYADAAAEHSFFKPDLRYLVVGLIDEFGELQDAIGLGSEAVPDLRHAILEAGDVLWYVGQIALMSDAWPATDDLGRWRNREGPAGRASISAIVLSLVRSIAALAGKVKKIERDADGQVTPAAQPELASLLEKILNDLDIIVMAAGGPSMTLAGVANRNLEKVAGRAARGTQHGSGDDR